LGDKEVLRRFKGLATAFFVGALLQVGAGPTDFLVFAGTPGPTTTQAVKVPDLSGKMVDPFAVSGDKPLVLVFVRTDCPISNRYAPTIQSLSQKYAGTALIMLVYPDKSETPQNIEKHLQDYGYKLTALRDTRHELVTLSKVEITPEAAVFKGRGKLIYHGRIDNWYVEFGHARNAPTTHELDEAIQAALNGARPVPASVSGVGCYISDLQ
jgi:thiol-disulfide isomerase/thioredoxin